VPIGAGLTMLTIAYILEGKRAVVWRRVCFSKLKWCAVQLGRLKFIQTVYKRRVCTSQRTNSVSSARLIS